PEDQVTSIRNPIAEGCGVLKTSRLVHVHPDTVRRHSRAAGQHAKARHDDWAAHSPKTREVPMDEQWSFVAQTEKNCDEDDPEDPFRGDGWDPVAFDSEHRRVWAGPPGERRAETVPEGVGDAQQRLEGRPPELITTAEYAPSEGAILETFGEEVVPPRTGQPGRPRQPSKVAPAG